MRIDKLPKKKNSYEIVSSAFKEEIGDILDAYTEGKLTKKETIVALSGNFINFLPLLKSTKN